MVCISMSYLGEDLDYDFLGPYRDKSTDEDDSDDDRSVNIGLASSSLTGRFRAPGFPGLASL